MCIIKTGDKGTNMHLQSESDERQSMKEPGGVCMKHEKWKVTQVNNFTCLYTQVCATGKFV